MPPAADSSGTSRCAQWEHRFHRSFRTHAITTARPLTIHVEHTDIDGNTHITVFDRGIARLVAHEGDHLHGHLYLDRMKPGTEPISVEQYRGTGTNWTY
ncbi:peptide deformylase [Nocardia sp. alder85J]|uniref:peptide deformylase n=1 Tax=Nocardia sp. alder85J TaxID=2862949 RepID=UPI001CD1FD66|nr:peptide deformylase [Nocardia sp. alder85J]MCX4091703.1 peptide deformylase [Nocardia sp. alder85J]